MDDDDEPEQDDRDDRGLTWGGICGAGLVILGIITGTMFLVIPLLIIAFIWYYWPRRR